METLTFAVLALVLSALAGLKLYLWQITGVCTSRRRLDGATAIVTGSNTGIGKETARDLAQRGARVILACRDLGRATAARDDIIMSTGNKQVEVRLLNLGSLHSVREFAKGFLASEDRLDILVNNAGVAGLKNRKTADGLDLTMQINHFGPFLLTNLLLDILKKSSPSRIIMVSSYLHKIGSVELDNLQCDRHVSPLQVYNNTKLCNILMAKELTRRLGGTGVTVNSLHPGVVWTDVFRNVSKWKHMIMNFVSKFYFKNPVEGAQTTIHLAVSEELEGISGKYFQDCMETNPASLALDPDLARRLWDASEEAVGLLHVSPVKLSDSI